MRLVTRRAAAASAGPAGRLSGRPKRKASHAVADGDNSEIEPGDLRVRVFLEADGPEDRE